MESVITIPSLGRPFKLGMLYDCRNEQLVPAVTLWGPETLKKSIRKENVMTNFNVSASNTWSEKASMLNVKANLQVSLLGGLIELKGSAKYLDDKHSTSRTERVALKSETMSHSEELTMEHMAHEKIEYPEVFDHGTATHVVTGIEYGGNAVFEFERNVSDSHEERVIEGSLEGVIKKIPFVDIHGKASVNMTDKDKEIAESFSCGFYGDCLLHENPSNFEEAVKIYKQLPALLSGHGYVPLVVRLYPLRKLDTRASKLIREISSTVAERIVELFENLDQICSRCDDLLLQRRNADIFLSIDQEIQDFKNTVGKYVTSMKSDISALLPKVRGGRETETKLWGIIDSNLSSSFSIDKLQKWLRQKQEGMEILSQYFQHLPGVKICKSEGEFNALIHKPDVSRLFCLTFERPSEDKILKVMKAYVNYAKMQLSDEDQDSVKSSGEEKLVPSVALVKMFKTFHEITKGNKNVAFGISEKHTSTSKTGTVIKVYNDGVCVDHEFIPPSTPGTPEILSDKTTHDSISLKWAASEFGNITKYEVVYRLKGCDDEKSVKADREEYTCFKIEGLSPGSEYHIKVRAVSAMGTGPMSGNSSLKTLPCEPTGKPVVKQVDTLSLQAIWQTPHSIGENVKIENYLVEVECAETDKRVIQKTISADQCFQTFTVKQNTTYRVFVTACCGEDGSSLRSDASEDLLIEVRKAELPKFGILSSAQIIEGDGTGQRIYHIPMEVKRQDEWIAKYEFGNPDYTKPEKVIMMVGATGSGKSTLINGLVNYLFGIEWKDPYRLKLIVETGRSQAKSQTTKITAYTFFYQPGFKCPFTLTVIDTPGFGDTGGIKRDEDIMRQMKDFFTTRGNGGIDHIDAVGFVAQSSDARLTVNLKYIFDQVLALFGHDIAKNIFMLLTFADANKPQILSALEEAQIPYQSFHKFNNSALYVDLNVTKSTDQEQDSDSESEYVPFEEMFWKMSRGSFKKFFNDLSQVQPCSLQLTSKVLQQREVLRAHADRIMTDIRKGLAKLEMLKKEMVTVKKHEALVAENSNFAYFDSRNILMCIQELWLKYKFAVDEKVYAEALLESICREFINIQKQVVELTKDITSSLNELKSIALKADPLSTTEYVDMMITNERNRAEPEWQTRIDHLQEVKDRVIHIEKCRHAGQSYDPFQNYDGLIKELMTKYSYLRM